MVVRFNQAQHNRESSHTKVEIQVSKQKLQTINSKHMGACFQFSQFTWLKPIQLFEKCSIRILCSSHL